LILKTDILSEIIKRKRERLEHTRALRPLEIVSAAAREARDKSRPHALRSALQGNTRLNIIAEIKRASPSKGIIKESFSPVDIARAYSRGGAVAISVLTEEDYFHGSLDDIGAVRAVSPLPILRKDFIVDEYQIYETAAAGADALLLIVAALSDDQLSQFRRIGEEELCLDALVEVHTDEEMVRAKGAGATLIGVNNRNLTTFEVSLQTSINLAPEATADTFLISESGLRSHDDLRRLQAAGYKGFLIGETLMRADDPTDVLRALINGPREQSVRVKVCGITNLKDALVCVDAGADMLGFNFYPNSLRYIEPEKARAIIEQLPSEITKVGIFVDEPTPEGLAVTADVAGVTAVQLHGEETPSYCRALSDQFVIKALRVQDNFKPERASEYQADAILLDAFSSTARGGTGKKFNWSVAQQVRPLVPRLFLAGGLTSENVKQAAQLVRPFAVDVCSSVESAPGRKDEERVKEFITAVKKSNNESAGLPE
jgi:indole-3-glycerol phosphate synthase / phosphoribosylanthranilate isomerase